MERLERKEAIRLNDARVLYSMLRDSVYHLSDEQREIEAQFFLVLRTLPSGGLNQVSDSETSANFTKYVLEHIKGRAGREKALSVASDLVEVCKVPIPEPTEVLIDKEEDAVIPLELTNAFAGMEDLVTDAIKTGQNQSINFLLGY